MIATLWPEADAGSVIQPQPLASGCFMRYLQPLTAPQAFDPLIDSMPSGISQHRGDPTITVPPVLPSQFDHIPDQNDPQSSRDFGVACDRCCLGPSRPGVRRCRTCPSPDRCRRGAVRGSEVSLRGFCQYELIKREIGNSSAETLVLLLQPLQLFELIRPHAAVLLPPAIIRLLRNLNLAYRIDPSWPCPTSTSTWRSFETISSGLCRFVAIFDPPKTKIFGGPIQWGTIILRSLQTLLSMNWA